MASGGSDELISQFMAFTGCLDGERANQYLEMSNMNVETAVGLFMEHEHSVSSGGGLDAHGNLNQSVAAGASHQVRAPDRTQRMRLMDDGMGPGYDMMDDQDIVMNAMSAFASVDARAAVNAAAAALDFDDDDDDDDEEQKEEAQGKSDDVTRLSDIFAQPIHLMHRGGGFQGARNVAKDARRWLLVNIQKDSEFACHALNRDVWGDDLVENLVREGFIFWQAYDSTPDGLTYIERYKVYDFPHIAIIDPRTGRSLWKKEGWTQEKPFTAGDFAEMAMDFCSRHSFDKAPLAPSKKPHSSSPVTGIAASERKRPFMTEQEQLQAAMAASLKSDDNDVLDISNDNYDMDEDDDDDEIECLGTSNDIARDDQKEEEKPPTFVSMLLATPLGDEPKDGARIQLRMPDGTRIVRKFANTDAVRIVYAFVAQHNDEAKAGKEFVLMAGFPPKDLKADLDMTIESCGLHGQAISVRWKE